jgi:hypothetical protein
MSGPTSERIDGPTPNGGVASVAYYRDAKGNPCPKDEAVGIEIHELKANGDVFWRTYLIRQPKGDET